MLFGRGGADTVLLGRGGAELSYLEGKELSWFIWEVRCCHRVIREGRG